MVHTVHIELTKTRGVIHTCKVDVTDILEQQSAIDSIHLRAEANFSRTQVFVHVMQRVSHGINGIDHKLDLPLLFIG